MKKRIAFITILLSIFFAVSVDAQVKSVEKEAESQGTNRINQRIDQGVSKGLDKIEDGIGSLFGKKKKKKGQATSEKTATTSENASTTSENASTNNSGSDNSVAGKDPEVLFQEYGIYPPDEATEVSISVSLKWTPINNDDFKAKSYEVYIDELNDGNPEDLMLGVSSKNEFTCKNLKPNTKYTWHSVGKSTSGQYMPGGGGSFTTGAGIGVSTEPKVVWSKFDFVPGDEVIFEDSPSTDEENGEFPSRWDLYKGSAEIGEVNGEPVIMFLDGGGSIIPYLKNSDEDYLPEVFTIEFDVWFEKRHTTNARYFIHFRDQKNQWDKGLGDWLSVNPTGLEFADTDKRYPGTEGLGWSEEPTGKWRHISIAYTKGKFKAYMDDTRLINVPHLEGNPWGLTIRALTDKMYLKNIRIAKGGVKYYESVLSDGKIIVNGIRFDVNKATIKPESNGAINEIFELMQKQTDLNFSVEGHTDSDGDDALNQSLSEQRAKAVMDRLISMGISSNRLKSAGWGESKPIGENGTAEGKANNRRVEFVKF